MAETVGAVLVRDNRVLLGLRVAHKSFAGDWDIIGGHIEYGEQKWSALCRELMEEIGVEPLSGHHLQSLIIRTPPQSSVLHVYIVSSWKGEPHIQNDEHTEICWFDVDAAALTPNLVAPDYRGIVQTLHRR